MFAILRLFLLAIVLMPSAVFAASGDWEVLKATSQVKFTTDRNSWKDLRTGDVVPNGAWVSTGPRGRAQLVRGVETIGLQPNTTASFTTKPGGFFTPRKTEIVQQVGALDLEIEKLSQPHTTVQTPYLAAVVKGTIFHVTVGKTKASVAVDRGLVQVTSFASGQQANVGPRQSASVARRSGMTVAGAIAKPSISSVPASVAVVQAVGATTLAGQAETAPDNSKSSQGAGRTSKNASGGNSSGKGNSGSSGDGGGNANGGGNNGHGSGGNSGNGGGSADSNHGSHGGGDNTGNNGNGGGKGKGNDGNGNGGNHGNGKGKK
ncbi:hypothetical protein CO657_36290 (plasmid) [Rhizobium acidisoli]|uniref:FecR protein domain-containing protein n=1 Tax=Rhizobium acidisoli TaxID=1538158 RepID=A0AAE6C585_9HYPH|nr:FecR domain-containing protein [Rhizobium acidisoli]KPH04839.1 hypothetical protein AOG23_31145 [Rhizobium acidisoli]QAS83218.1 hypothetical protein CO657_36290 [Rhizobium acidisoli]